MDLNELPAMANGDYDSALRELEHSLKTAQDSGDKAAEAITLNNISQIYDAQGDYDTALSYLEHSLQIMQDINDKAGECVTLVNIGHIVWKNDQPQAVAIWLSGYKIAKEINLYPALQVFNQLAKNLGGTGLEFWES